MKRITITRDSNGKVQFQTVSVDNTENVFFLNKDPQSAHWPAFFTNKPFTSNLVGQNGGISSASPVPAPPAGTNQVTYGCLLTGHYEERGVINVFSPLAAKVTNLPAAAVNKAITPLQLVRGGMSPYTISRELFQVTDSNGNVTSGAGIVPGLQLDPRTDNSGVWLKGTPTTPGTYVFTFTVDDAMGGNLQQVQWTMKVA